ncbi:hypothetical protein CLV84_3087 [Neolewinella xylanilytica]|uniref:Uncharacterized protein n=1 Tax=Neolewinella xylanilytica TaxID=1514080 RepID=A0A2S6I4T7_9BACT|nr:hypothetical protein [Neolewinella xylanilytica]PPK86168.1 hypothetical protein CLV84_3087 [Neolewinella xylanilytica]
MANKKQIFSSLVVVLLLVGFPAVSFYYLKQGADYRRSALAEREDFGNMPDLYQFPAVRGELPETLRGAMTVVGWLDPTKEAGTRIYGETLDSLFQQFEESPNLYFTTLILGENPEQVADSFATRYNLPENDMISFLRADERTFARSAEQFKLPLGTYDSPGIQPVVALVDSSLTIVKHYDLARRDQTIGLVQLISLIIPLPEKQEIILDRGKEL